ncbi:MAG TPA: MazG family protein [Candidatus Limnocylindria bacterium]
MGEAVAEVARVADRLRAPGGCPWDREQTHASLRPFVLEEAYEVLEALDTGNAAMLREELGDLLFQVVIHAQLAREDGGFDLGEVAAGLAEKLVRRHPHVFEGKAIEGDVLSQWEQIKKDEKRDAAAALRRANEHFAERVRKMEQRATADGRTLGSYDADELWAIWEATA